MKQKWIALDPNVRKALIVGAALDGIGRIAALVDLARRSPAQVNGSKKVWAVSLGLLNSAGIVPAAYFLRGRR
ncbi:hypothetical protein [Calidifontibacter terrae]